jgi:hypothetical protein
MGKLLNKLVPTSVSDQEIYDLGSYLDSDGTGFIDSKDLMKAWLAGMRVQTGMIGTIKKLKGQILSFSNKVEPLLNDLLDDPSMKEDLKAKDLYSKNDMTINLCNPPKGKNVKTEITTEIEMLSQQGIKNYKDLLKLHPSLKVTEEEPRIWSMTIQLEAPLEEKQGKALQYLQNFLSKSMG